MPKVQNSKQFHLEDGPFHCSKNIPICVQDKLGHLLAFAAFGYCKLEFIWEL